MVTSISLGSVRAEQPSEAKAPPARRTSVSSRRQAGTEETLSHRLARAQPAVLRHGLMDPSLRRAFNRAFRPELYHEYLSRLEMTKHQSHQRILISLTRQSHQNPLNHLKNGLAKQ